jgi:putative transposase
MTRPTKNQKPAPELGEHMFALLKEDLRMKELLQTMIQATLEAEMDEALGAAKSQRTDGHRGHRSGYYTRHFVTRFGKLELRVPQDREGLFSTEIFERYQRSERALVVALAEMYVQGVSTRKVAAVTEQLCGHAFSAAAVSAAAARLDAQLTEMMRRPLEEEFPYLILDARYEKVREDHAIRSRAVLVAIGVDWEGRRQVLAVELAARESASSWQDFLLGLKERGLHGVRLAVTDSHPGLKQAVSRVLPGALWQRCYVHFLRNALDHLSRNAAPAVLHELRWIYEQGTAAEARAALRAWLTKWASAHPRLCAWVEAEIEDTFAFLALPRPHHKHLKSTNLLERLNEELKRRTRVVRIFPNPESCLRLSRALALEQHEDWMESSRYLNMELLRDHRDKGPATPLTTPLAQAA